ncbi:3'-5' exonuclease [Aquibacillus saliphilus]|uniref:3'-5' exonuclease n=1 Tax=Aquibacillus saliphilus TaxID=1909422 RepID=UPI001CF09D9C|nr:3'-5' exonuclease [Aquibacillus saliphilus]
MNLVSIDFETANRYRTSACAIGIVVANQDGIIDEYYSLINPLMEFESQNIYVHGITENDVADAPTFAEIWPVINEYLSDEIVVAHNASFDMSVLRAVLDRYDLQYPEFEYLCSVMISKKVWPGMPNYKLNTLADMIGSNFSHHHALDDSRVVIHLLLQAIREKQVDNLKDLVDSFQISCGKIFEKGYITPKAKRANRRNVTSRTNV